MSAPAAGLPVLMVLRVKGRADAATVAAASGVAPAEAEAVLADGGTRGTTRRVGDAWALTPAGRDEVTRLAAAEPLDRTALAAAYREFLAADPLLKDAVTAWQRADPSARAGAARAVVATAERAVAAAAQVARVAPRWAPYAARLAAARHAVIAGDQERIASPRTDSLHQVWFELHEDLLVTLGLARQA